MRTKGHSRIIKSFLAQYFKASFQQPTGSPPLSASFNGMAVPLYSPNTQAEPNAKPYHAGLNTHEYGQMGNNL